ncbi:phospho-N-acetylmuramoyl-pentapeptide-transferase [Subtercola sp. YIM 133946]|uniref:phospho-N-acetylmuramoyl-pentapeptide- transferase n=1 Tax=Subtercola sp. YIM 133946 TaxID=3118909 RepID=UPI002F94E21D
MITLITAGGLSMLFSLFMTPVFIRLFKRLAWGQYINIDGPSTHQVKRGTPTMGGIVIILAVLFGYFVALLITQNPPSVSVLLVLYLMVGLGLVGFIDDFIKTRKKRNLGLGPKAKLAGQIFFGGTYALLAIQFPNNVGLTPVSTHISVVRDLNFDFLGGVGWVLIAGFVAFLVWIILIVMATSNAVNLTDGLDGLAPGSAILAIGSFVIIGFWQSNQSCQSATLDPDVAFKCYNVDQPLDLAVIAAAVAGALIGFLWWNTNPAKIFLGDTGSLAIGGALAALAIESRTELLLILIGGIFVIVAGQVVVQLTYFRLTGGKRIWRASPLHHHFEVKGWAEVTIVVRFWIIAGLCVAAGVGAFYLEWILQA